MARFCTQPYSKPNQRNLHETYMHLTNYSLNKHSKNFVLSDHEDNGSKRTLTSVFYRMEAQGLDVVSIWHNIEKLICKTVIAFVPELKVYMHAENSSGNGPTCFHVSQTKDSFSQKMRKQHSLTITLFRSLDSMCSSSTISSRCCSR